jgi:hypothetical protein
LTYLKGLGLSFLPRCPRILPRYFICLTLMPREAVGTYALHISSLYPVDIITIHVHGTFRHVHPRNGASKTPVDRSSCGLPGQADSVFFFFFLFPFFFFYMLIFFFPCPFYAICKCNIQNCKSKVATFPQSCPSSVATGQRETVPRVYSSLMSWRPERAPTETFLSLSWDFFLFFFFSFLPFSSPPRDPASR